MDKKRTKKTGVRLPCSILDVSNPDDATQELARIWPKFYSDHGPIVSKRNYKKRMQSDKYRLLMDSIGKDFRCCRAFWQLYPRPHVPYVGKIVSQE